MKGDGALVFIAYAVVFAVVLAGYDAGPTRHGSSRVRIRRLLPKSFASVQLNSHHEVELRLGFDRVIATEITQRSEAGPGYSISIRQATDGRRLVQSVIQNGALKECDFTKDQEQIVAFVNKFIESNDFRQTEFGDILTAYDDNDKIIAEANSTLANKYYDTSIVPGEFSHFLDIRKQRKQCRDFTKMAKTISRQEAKHAKRGENLNASDPQTNALNAAVNARRIELAEQYGILFNSGDVADDVQTPITKRITSASANARKRSRTKRGAFDFSSVLIFPGTKWCGKGDLATCFDDLGDDKELDVCCRDHDCCPFVIPPLSSKFNTFNYRFHSLLHCECDQRFRGCLRKSPSSTADMIGKIYFNILGSRCFEFEEVEVCAERAWYGYCRRYETQHKAVVKTQQSFYDQCASRNESTTTSDDESTSRTKSTTTTSGTIGG